MRCRLILGHMVCLTVVFAAAAAVGQEKGFYLRELNLTEAGIQDLFLISQSMGDFCQMPEENTRLCQGTMLPRFFFVPR